jgi:hypothetical protein
VSGWQPIETAPRERDFLAWDGKWVFMCCVGWYEDGKPVFVDSGNYLARKPTHWQPLPPPPEQDGAP